MKKGKFIIISGPSGVGKGTIYNVLLKELNAWYSVSMTTRDIRDGEVDGVNYYFISKDEFKKRIDAGKLLEYNVYNDNYYGTPKDKVLEKLEQGIDVILEIDVNGARNIKNYYNKGLININEANHLILFTHFSNPVFILSTFNQKPLNL